MLTEGYKPHTAPRLGSLIAWDDPATIPFGLGKLVQNCRFLFKGVATRYGLRRTLSLPAGVAANGLAAFVYQAATNLSQIFVHGSDGGLRAENPAGSGTLAGVTSPIVKTTAGGYMVAAEGFNKLFMAFGDLIKGTDLPALYDGASNTLNPCSNLAIGSPWTPSTQYFVGQVISVINGGGLVVVFVCSTAGISGAGPAPPAGLTGATQGSAAVVADNTAAWTENTPFAGTIIEPTAQLIPVLTRNAGAGAFAAGKDVYVLCTYGNGFGETTPPNNGALLGYSVLVNTVLNDAITVAIQLPPWPASAVVGTGAPTNWNIYTFVQNTGLAAPTSSSVFQQVINNIVFPTVSHQITAAGAGISPPTISSAWMGAPGGHVAAGVRYLFITYGVITGYKFGVTNGQQAPSQANQLVGAVIAADVPQTGVLYIGNLPKGPGAGYTTSRIIALTTAAGSQGSGFFYIPFSEVAYGFNNTATQINDNTTVNMILDFDDAFLQVGVNLDYLFNVQQIPPVKDVYYSKSLQSMIYTGVAALSSAHLISLPNDPETWDAANNTLQIAQGDEDRTVTWRDFRTQLYSMKQRSGYLVTPVSSGTGTSSGASIWNVKDVWFGYGPGGPKAVDVAGDDFMVFADDSGVYEFNGASASIMSPELRDLFKRVNKAAKQTMWVSVDQTEKEFRVGLPLDGATVPSHILTCNYQLGTGWPLAYTKRVLPRKWSLDIIKANLALRVYSRPLSAPPDPSMAVSQVLVASNVLADGIHMISPNIYDDNGVGIDSQWESTPANDGPGVQSDCCGASMDVKGNGLMSVTFVPQSQVNLDRQTPQQEKPARDVNLVAALQTVSRGTVGVSPGWGIRFTNKAVAGAWFLVEDLTIWLQARFGSRE